MQKKSAKTNYIYNLIYQIFSLITPLVTTPYVSRVLGSDGVGQYTFTHSIATYFVLLGSLGFGYYAQREIARHQGSREEQSKIFWEIILCRLVMVSLSVTIYLALLSFNVYDPAYTALMWILLINVAATAFDIVFLFQGNEEFGTILARNIIIKCIGIALIFIFVKQSSDVWIYVLCQSLTLLLSNLSLWFKLRRKLVRVKIADLNIRQHFIPSLRLFIPTLAISVYTVLDKTLIGSLITGVNEAGKRYSEIENGNYEQSEKIIKLSLTVLTSIGVVMLPKNSQTIAAGDLDSFKENMGKVIRFIFFLGFPLAFGLSAIAFNFSPWFFGEGYEKVPLLMICFSPLILIIGLSNALGLQYLIPLKKDKLFTIAILSGAASNLILNVVLIPLLWSFGACIATLVGELVVTAMMAFFARKDINLGKNILKSWKSILASAIMFGAVFFTQHFLKPSILNTLLLGLEGILIYFSLLALFRDEFFFKIIKMVLNGLSRKKSND